MISKKIILMGTLALALFTACNSEKESPNPDSTKSVATSTAEKKEKKEIVMN